MFSTKEQGAKVIPLPFNPRRRRKESRTTRPFGVMLTQGEKRHFSRFGKVPLHQPHDHKGIIGVFRKDVGKHATPINSIRVRLQRAWGRITGASRDQRPRGFFGRG